MMINKFQKIFSLAMLFIAIICFSGCSKKNELAPESATEERPIIDEKKYEVSLKPLMGVDVPVSFVHKSTDEQLLNNFDVDSISSTNTYAINKSSSNGLKLTEIILSNDQTLINFKPQNDSKVSIYVSTRKDCGSGEKLLQCAFAGALGMPGLIEDIEQRIVLNAKSEKFIAQKIVGISQDSYIPPQGVTAVFPAIDKQNISDSYITSEGFNIDGINLPKLSNEQIEKQQNLIHNLNQRPIETLSVNFLMQLVNRSNQYPELQEATSNLLVNKLTNSRNLGAYSFALRNINEYAPNREKIIEGYTELILRDVVAPLKDR